MRVVILGLVCVLLTGCLMAEPAVELPTDCRPDAPLAELLDKSWLQNQGVWRLRQSALLEWGLRKTPLEGFVRLDLRAKQAHLLAMNELGLVLFELKVDEREEQLLRSVPQLAKTKGFERGIAQSLRQIFLSPVPNGTDVLEQRDHSQRLQRDISAGRQEFLYDCRGDLRRTRFKGEAGDWQVNYDSYQEHGQFRLPEQIVHQNSRHGVKLTIWLREVKQEQ